MCVCVYTFVETNTYALNNFFLQQGTSTRGTRVYFEKDAWSAHSQLELSWHSDPVSEAGHALAMAVACGVGFTIVVTEHGDAWACGRNDVGQLGLGSQADQLLPAHVGGREVFAGEPLVMMSAGSKPPQATITAGDSPNISLPSRSGRCLGSLSTCPSWP